MTTHTHLSSSPQSIDQPDEEQSERFVHALAQSFDVQPTQATWLQQTDSTQKALVRLYANNSEPRVVVARTQTQGMGQSGRPWMSPVGNLYLSYAQALSVPLQGHLALEVALAILAQPMFAAHPRLGIKWPNDLHHHVHGTWAKWGGILIEPLGRQQVMIGVGINCVSMAQQIGDQAVTDLGQVLDTMPDLLSLACNIVHACQQAVRQFEHGSPQLSARFCPVDSLANGLVRVEQSHQSIIGRADGIDADGALRVVNSDGLHRLYSGHVRRMDQ